MADGGLKATKLFRAARFNPRLPGKVSRAALSSAPYDGLAPLPATTSLYGTHPWLPKLGEFLNSDLNPPDADWRVIGKSGCERQQVGTINLHRGRSSCSVLTGSNDLGTSPPPDIYCSSARLEASSGAGIAASITAVNHPAFSASVARHCDRDFASPDDIGAPEHKEDCKAPG
ncbi:hypothetical protein SKAU_G00074810 [Synaphobranchus kaupii]|uniref:Uncharacterized protein n=1 Tax=Synaphobranchus kaupii TaxID=118154 RepID=A0A9Q1G7Y6_SYNKA|nr:hypothetical protein SKAU_G00074810 [Synaphobranchus kaupii]